MSSKDWIIKGERIDGINGGDQFGNSVSISDNGKMVAVGAVEKDPSGVNIGYVKVYEYSDSSSNWYQMGMDLSGSAVGDEFGFSVSLSSDPSGSIVAVGAIQEESRNEGYVKVYKYIDTSDNWYQIGSDIIGSSSGDNTGFSVSLSGRDGSDNYVLAVGQPKRNDGAKENGVVKIYEYKDISGDWYQIGDDLSGASDGDSFGYSVSISSNGKILAVGSPGSDLNGFSSGKASFYEYIDISENWYQMGTDISGSDTFNDFGYSISLTNDGSKVAIGAPGNDEGGIQSGQVKVYEYIDASGDWYQVGDDINGKEVGELSGTSVSISDDGDFVAIGAPYNNNGGKVRVYKYDTNWEEIGGDINPDEGNHDLNGYSVSLSSDGKDVAVGSIQYDASHNHTGYARVLSLVTIVPSTPVSRICFIGSTPIDTDQGRIIISKIIPGFHKINGKEIKEITKTKTSDKYLYKIRRNAFSRNVPSKDLTLSGYHMIEYNGTMIQANDLLNLPKVERVEYKNEILYNILMENYEIIQVNNLNVETLHPDNIIAKLYTDKKFKKMKQINKNKLIDLFNKKEEIKELNQEFQFFAKCFSKCKLMLEKLSSLPLRS